jgi:hypothetical protein
VSIVRRNNMKKIWKKPELVVLVRSRPEESVLEHCKSGATAGPYTEHASVCFVIRTDPQPNCLFCSLQGAS